MIMQAMELRKVCNHPFLCDGLEENLITKYGHNYTKHVSFLTPFRSIHVNVALKIGGGVV